MISEKCFLFHLIQIFLTTIFIYREYKSTYESGLFTHIIMQTKYAYAAFFCKNSILIILMHILIETQQQFYTWCFME